MFIPSMDIVIVVNMFIPNMDIVIVVKAWISNLVHTTRFLE
jgi:hypothetical protein